jgi:hypothetical protein
VAAGCHCRFVLFPPFDTWPRRKQESRRQSQKGVEETTVGVSEIVFEIDALKVDIYGIGGEEKSKPLERPLEPF